MKILFVAFLTCVYVWLTMDIVPTMLWGHAPQGMEVIDLMGISVLIPGTVIAIYYFIRSFRA